MQDNQNHNSALSFRSFLGFVAFMARTLAVSVEVFLREVNSFGDRYLGLQAGAALLLIFFWPAFCEPIYDPTPMLLFAGLYFVACVLIRLGTLIRRRRGGPQPHTRYSGRPVLMRFTRRMDEVKVKGVVEPLFTFAAGGIALAFNPPLGGYLMFASVGLLVSHGLAGEIERRRSWDMHDAYLEQRRNAEKFRDMRGE